MLGFIGEVALGFTLGMLAQVAILLAFYWPMPRDLRRTGLPWRVVLLTVKDRFALDCARAGTRPDKRDTFGGVIARFAAFLYSGGRLCAPQAGSAPPQSSEED